MRVTSSRWGFRIALLSSDVIVRSPVLLTGSRYENQAVHTARHAFDIEDRACFHFDQNEPYQSVKAGRIVFKIDSPTRYARPDLILSFTGGMSRRRISRSSPTSSFFFLSGAAGLPA